VLGCNSGWSPSEDPQARCVGQTQTTSLIEFRQFHCKRETSKREDESGWVCLLTGTGATQCVPKAPSVGWKRHGSINLHWTALGRSVTRLNVKYGLASGGPVTTSADLTPNPGFITSFEIQGLQVGQSYAFWLVAETSEGSATQVNSGRMLYTQV